MSEAELTISTSTDSAAVAEAVAAGEEARSEAPTFVSEELDGVSRESNSGAPPRPSRSLSYEHPQSSRLRVLEALNEAEAELSQSTEQVATAEQQSDNIDIEEVRRIATSDAIEAARRQQQERDDYYRQQENQHFSPQAEIQKLRAQHYPILNAKLNALTADADPALQESALIPLSANPATAARLMDSFATLPGGAEAAGWLMRNPAEKRKLAALPEHMAQVRIAQLANRFDPDLQRRPSQAPPPIRPIGGSATTSALPADELPYQEFKKRREQEIRSRRR